MRKLIMWNLVTLDGYFEGPEKWALDWHELVWGDELEEYSISQLKSAGLLVFGRITYEGMASYWQSAEGEIADLTNGIAKVVFSRTLDEAAWSNTRLVSTDAADEVARLKEQAGADMLVFGSAALSAELMERGLIDEFRLCIVPVVLGAGTPLFKAGVPRTELTTLDVTPLRSGGVILRGTPRTA
jgi:dihydrofolate reductase